MTKSYFVFFALCTLVGDVLTKTEAPIIGVLSQETFSIQHLFPDTNYSSYIAASYVKFLESAGARVVPILIGQPVDYYKNIIKKTNGVLLPGGATFFNQSDGFADAGQIIYNLALQVNRKEGYYPIFSICLGMELLAQVAVNGQELRAHCYSKKESLPLNFKTDYRQSKLFSQASETVLRDFETKNVTYNYHMFCITEANMTTFGLSADWKVLSTNIDKYGLEFVSAFESRSYPFYGVQFHPEKPPYEFKKSLNIPHSLEAIRVSEYLANFFVTETKMNNHKFNTKDEEQKALIYNYPVHYTGIQNGSYEQIYLFE